MTRNFYISPTGNDSTGAGSLSDPWATLEKARSSIAGTVSGTVNIWLRGGTYYLANMFALADAADSPPVGSQVNYIAYPGESPVISGGTVLTNWTQTSSSPNLWECPLATYVRAFHVDGQQCYRNRPLANSYNMTGFSINGDAGFGGTGGLLNGAANPTDIELIIDGTSNWMQDKLPVFSTDSTHINIKSPVMHNWNNSTNRAGTKPTYVENCKEYFNDAINGQEPGEFYWDRAAQKIYYYPRTPTMTGVLAVAATLDGSLIQCSAKRTNFIGLKFTENQWTSPVTNGFIEIQANNYVIAPWDNTVGSAPFYVPAAALEIHGPATDVLVQGCLFSRLGTAGLRIGAGTTRTTVTRCQFDSVGSVGIFVGDPGDVVGYSTSPADAVLIDNCAISFTGTETAAAPGIVILGLNASNSTIQYCNIHDISYSGISWGLSAAGFIAPASSMNNLIQYNHIYRTNLSYPDGGGIYVNGNNVSTSSSYTPSIKIRGNHVHTIGGTSPMIYVDDNSNAVEVSGNVCHSSTTWLLAKYAAPGNDITGNFIDNTSAVASADVHNSYTPASTPFATRDADPRTTYASIVDAAGLRPGSDYLDPKALTFFLPQRNSRAFARTGGPNRLVGTIAALPITGTIAWRSKVNAVDNSGQSLLFRITVPGTSNMVAQAARQSSANHDYAAPTVADISIPNAASDAIHHPGLPRGMGVYSVSNAIFHTWSMTWGAGLAKLYCDGILMGSAVYALSPYRAAGTKLTIGNYETEVGNAGANSSMADFSWWNVELTVDEIASLNYIDPTAVHPAALIRSYPINGASPELDSTGANGLTVSNTTLETATPSYLANAPLAAAIIAMSDVTATGVSVAVILEPSGGVGALTNTLQYKKNTDSWPGMDAVGLSVTGLTPGTYDFRYSTTDANGTVASNTLTTATAATAGDGRTRSRGRGLLSRNR